MEWRNGKDPFVCFLACLIVFISVFKMRSHCAAQDEATGGVKSLAVLPSCEPYNSSLRDRTHWCNNGTAIMFTINHSHIEFEVCLLYRTEYLPSTIDPVKNMAEEVLGPCLAKETRTKLLSKYLCLCPNKNVIPSLD